MVLFIGLYLQNIISGCHECWNKIVLGFDWYNSKSSLLMAILIVVFGDLPNYR